jgi:hypothetical protein
VVGEAVRVTVGAWTAATCSDRGATCADAENALASLLSMTLGLGLVLNCAATAGVASAVPAAEPAAGAAEPGEQAAITQIIAQGIDQRAKRGANAAINPP